MGRGDAEETRSRGWRQNERTWFWVELERKEGRKQLGFFYFLYKNVNKNLCMNNAE